MEASGSKAVESAQEAKSMPKAEFGSPPLTGKDDPHGRGRGRGEMNRPRHSRNPRPESNPTKEEPKILGYSAVLNALDGALANNQVRLHEQSIRSTANQSIV